MPCGMILDKTLTRNATAGTCALRLSETRKIFLALLAMSFLWVGSQIPLYLFGSILPLIYSDIGGADRYVWMVIGYLIPCAGLCPFVGALSDMFGRRNVGLTGQLLLILGPIVTSTAKTMNSSSGSQCEPDSIGVV